MKFVTAHFLWVICWEVPYNSVSSSADKVLFLCLLKYFYFLKFEYIIPTVDFSVFKYLACLIFSELPASILYYLSLILENIWLNLSLHSVFFPPFSILIAHELHLLKLSYGSLSFLFFLFLFLPVFKFGRFLLSYILAHWSFPQLCPVYWWDDQRILQTCSSVFHFQHLLLILS